MLSVNSDGLTSLLIWIPFIIIIIFVFSDCHGFDLQNCVEYK